VHKKLMQIVTTWREKRHILPMRQSILPPELSTSAARRGRAIAKPKRVTKAKTSRKRTRRSNDDDDDESGGGARFGRTSSSNFNEDEKPQQRTPKRDLSFLPKHLQAGYRALYAKMDRGEY
jgi:hypothetical protein